MQNLKYKLKRFLKIKTNVILGIILFSPFYVISQIAPTVSISASDDDFCNGATIFFTANPQNNSALSYYNFFVNGISKQNTTSTEFSTNELLNNDKIWTQLYSIPLNRGYIDSSFEVGVGFDTIVQTMAIQSDGKIIVAGDFTYYNGIPVNRIVRLNTNGSIDDTFSIGDGFDNSVRTIAIQSDGKILVGGYFTTYNGDTNKRIIRLNSDGTKDMTFDSGSGFDKNAVLSIKIQSDGKIVAGGGFTFYNGVPRKRIIRIESNGSIDNSFTIGNGFNSTVYSVDLQSDGKIIAGGIFTAYKGLAQNSIARLNSDGSLDNSFVIGTGINNSVYCVKYQTDGKIVIAGNFTTYNGFGKNKIVRLNTDGSIDDEFVIGTGFSGVVYNLNILSDSRIIVTGAFTSYNGTARNRIISLNSDGSIDSLYNTGKGLNNVAYVSINDANGNILAGGTFTTYQLRGSGRIVKIMNASNDLNFANSDTVTVNVHFLPNNVNVSPINSSICHGETVTIAASGASTYIWSHGLGTDSIVNFLPETTSTVTVTGYNDWGCYMSAEASIIVHPLPEVFISPNYPIICGGTSVTLKANGATSYEWSEGLGTNEEVTLSPNETKIYYVTGTDDNNCSSSSQVKVSVHETTVLLTSDKNIICKNDTVTFVATSTNAGNTPIYNFQINGNVVQSSSSNTCKTTTLSQNDVVTCELNATADSIGMVDNSLDVGSGFDGIVHQIVRQSDGKFLVVGEFTTFNGDSVNRIVRLNPNGTRDFTFNSGTGFNNSVRTVFVQPNGKILVGGLFTDYNGTIANRIIRLNSDGSIDNSFDCGSGFNNIVYCVLGQNDGKILIVGQFTTYNGSTNNRIIRLNQDGSVDSQFITGTGFGNSYAYKLKIQSDGKILVIGAFTSYNGIMGINRIIRLNNDGTIDNTFNTGTGADVTVYAIDIQKDGKIIIAGAFTTFNNVLKNRIIRLNSDGSEDLTFITGTGFGSNVYDIVVQPDDKILIGGHFTNYSGNPRNRLIRVFSDGSIDNSFQIGTGFNNNCRTIFLQEDGKVLIGGTFTTYKGLTTPNIVRLNNTICFSPTVVSNSILMTVNPSPIIEVSANPLSICQMQSTTINATSDIEIDTWIWNTGQLVSEFSDTPSATQKYIVTATTTLGCMAIDSMEVTVNPIPVIEISPMNPSICEGASATLNVSGASNYTWSNGLGNNASVVVTPSIPTTYSVTATDMHGCVSSASTFVNVLSNPIVHISPLNASICPSGTIELTAFGANTYEWSHGLGTGSTKTVQPLTTTVYSVTGSAGNGCFSYAEKLVTVFTGPQIELVSDNNNVCNGVPVTFTAKAKYIKNTPIIQFYVNGGLVQSSTDSVFTYSSLSNGDVVKSTMSNVEQSQGVLDESFNKFSFNSSIQTAAVANNGKIYIGGSFTQANGVSKNRIIGLEANGSENLVFNVDSGFNNIVQAIAVQSDNKIIVVGSFTKYQGQSSNRIIRLNTDGSIDTGFNVGGGFNNLVNDVVIQSDGKILVGGNFSAYNGKACVRIARLNSDGSFDSSFNPGNGFSSQVRKIAVQNDGKILVVGDFGYINGTPSARIARLLDDGSIDASFIVGNGFTGNAYTLVIQNDGKIIVGGAFTAYKGTPVSKIARLNVNGSIDNTFTVGTGFNNSVTSMISLPNDKCFIGGSFTSYKGNTANRLIKLNADGSIDNDFQTGTGFNNVVNSLTLLPDGMLLVGGVYTTYQGKTADKIAIISNNICDITTASSNQITMIVGQPGCGSKSLQPVISNTKLEYCENEFSNSFVLKNYSNEQITWQKRQMGHEWVDVGENTSMYFDSNLKAGYWEYRTVLDKNTENEKNSNSIIIKVNRIPKADFSYEINGSNIDFNYSDVVDLLSWNFGDGMVSDVSQPTHMYRDNGQYIVLLDVSNGNCKSSISKNIEIKNLIITDQEFNFTVYPNPSLNGLFNLLYTSEVNLEKANIQVFDSFGKIIYSEMVSEIMKGSIIKLDLSKNSAGLYLMKIAHSKGIHVIKIAIR